MSRAVEVVRNTHVLPTPTLDFDTFLEFMTQLEEGRLQVKPWWVQPALRKAYPKERVQRVEAGPLCMYTEAVRRYSLFEGRMHIPNKKLGAQRLPTPSQFLTTRQHGASMP